MACSFHLCDTPSQIAKYTLQKLLFLHFFEEKFVYMKKL